MQEGSANINGISMYYAVYGQGGTPLVLVHGGGSTHEISFGRIIPRLSEKQKVIAVELQAHGRTTDRDSDLSFEQDADDVAALIRHLNVQPANVFGFSNGATTALQLVIRHPELVNKLVLGSVLTKRSGAPTDFWHFMEQVSVDQVPPALRKAYLEIVPDPERFRIMHDRDAKRMVHFRDIPDELIRQVKAPTLLINGDRDLISNEHVLALHQLIAGSRLAILPGTHGEYIGEVTTLPQDSGEPNLVAVPLIEQFLDSTTP